MFVVVAQRLLKNNQTKLMPEKLVSDVSACKNDIEIGNSSNGSNLAVWLRNLFDYYQKDSQSDSLSGCLHPTKGHRAIDSCSVCSRCVGIVVVFKAVVVYRRDVLKQMLSGWGLCLVLTCVVKSVL